jgi:hypothetical protein
MSNKLLAGLLVLALSSGCRSHPLAVVPAASPAALAASAPVVHTVFTRTTERAIEMTVLYEHDGGLVDFDPERPGGWCFQLFLDTDRRPTGYGRGYDYLVRGIERAPGGRLYLRSTEAGTGPGGWGEALGAVPARATGRRLTVSIPLELLADDGQLDYSLELYATVGTAEDVSHAFAANYAGTSSPHPHAPTRGERAIAWAADRR